VRISVNVTNFSWPRDIAANLAEVARAADEAGIDTLWVGDHLLQADPTASPEQEMLEGYTTLGFLASCTSRVRLGTMVTAATYRAPALLVKAVTTLDVLSAGRAWLGIGAGYHEQEAEDFGLDLPVVRGERFERLAETVRLALQMWAGDDSPFAGRHTRLGHPVSNPGPVTRPHPPVLIGGMGEKRTLRLVAELGDACNLPDIPDGGATVRRKLGVLAGHCAEVGRPYEEIQKTLSTRWAPDESAADFAGRCATYAGWGIEHVVLITTGPWTASSVSLLGRAVEAVR
jgi:F420-dependent oxidoreductase-like protein